jgi:hypothetical protein
MANKASFEVRFRAAVRDAAEEVFGGGSFSPEEELPEAAEGEALFTAIEDLALSAGDAISREVFEQQLEQLPAEAAVCPLCQAEGRRVKQRDRTFTTRLGFS